MIQPFKYAFFGSPRFAEIILEKLISAGMPPDVVICNPDRPVGRKKVITPPPVKTRIVDSLPTGDVPKGHELWSKGQIKILQPEKLDANFCDSLFSIHDSFDFFVVAAYAKIIPSEILKLSRLGVIGIHPSLLPKYRGATPIQTAILNGDEETGVTLYVLDEKVDHGQIIAQKTYNLRHTTYEEVEEKLAKLGGELLVEILPKFIAGEIKPRTQDENQATFTKKFKTEDGFVKWTELEKAQNEGGEVAAQLDRKIRALSHEPGVWTLRQAQGKQQRMKLLEAILSPEGKLVLKKIQAEGKKEQNV